VERRCLAFIGLLLIVSVAISHTNIARAQGDPNKVFVEKDGVLVVEAENAVSQSHFNVRQWYLTTVDKTPNVKPDGDENHAETASGKAYIEILPDTRRTHGDRLKSGENFTNTPGKMAIIYYPVQINKPGRYYFWARICCTGSEDNGIHVGIDGTWPESGQRMQFIGKHGQWQWDSKQRTDKVHTGVKYKFYLDVKRPGRHMIMISMREDGFELDKWMMTLERDPMRSQSTEMGPPESETIRR